MTWSWGEDRRTLTVLTLYFVWAQLIHGFADQHRFWCFIYVFWVYVYVEQREDAHHYVHDDQPACHTTHDDVHMITPIAVADEWSVQWVHMCVFNGADGKAW